MSKYEVAVIGGGIGGYICAARLARSGKRVVLVEKDKIGGVCLNYGCIPTKALIQISSIVRSLDRFGGRGIDVRGAEVRLGDFLSWKNKVVGKLRDGVETILRRSGVDVVKGEAKLRSRHEISITGGGSVEADNIVIATGSRPITIRGLEFDGEVVINSTEALEMDHVPDSLCIIGAGVIGVEIGQSMTALGSKVTMVEMMDHVLPGFGRDLTMFVQKELKKAGVSLFLRSTAKGVEKRGNRAVVRITGEDGEREEEFDYVLVAVGRRPHIEGLNLETIGVEFDAKTGITVGPGMRTTVPGIYAIGDVTGGPMLAHKALYEALVASDEILGRKRKESTPIPVVVYSKPEVAQVGISEGEANRRGLNVRVGKFYFNASGRAMTMDEAQGVLKMVVDSSSKKVLGVEIAGPEASELISIGALAVTLELKVDQIAEVVFPHPTLSEAFEEVAHILIDDPLHTIR